MKKALIAMSGGVDSSVTAYLMQQAGYECMGTTLKLFEKEEEGTCGSSQDIEDARAVAKGLNMPFEVLNYEGDFSQEVMQRFVQAYQLGHTPNPCIDCNRHVKFEKIFQQMQKLNLDKIATGHYARIGFDEESGRWLLKKGKDAGKDQSYVLYNLTQEQLSHTCFPVGEYSKAEIRQIAEKMGFVSANKPDSQDICFIPDGDYAGFIERFTGTTAEPGEFVNTSGEVLGQHRGLIHYTVGQRRGLGISGPEPYYVCDIQSKENRVVIGTNQDLFSRGLLAVDINYISVPNLKTPKHVTAKIRYRHQAQPALAWENEAGQLCVEFKEPQRAITCGQAVVLYDGDIVVAGGTIVSKQEFH